MRDSRECAPSVPTRNERARAMVCCLAARKAWVVALANTAPCTAGRLPHRCRNDRGEARCPRSAPPVALGQQPGSRLVFSATHARTHAGEEAPARPGPRAGSRQHGRQRAFRTGLQTCSRHRTGWRRPRCRQCAAWRAAHPGPPRGAFASWRELTPGLAAAGSDPDLPAGVIVVPRREL